MNEPSLTLSEAFGPTVQGEGPFTGQQAIFIRLGGCNLTCTWCDTPYTWDGKRYDLRKELTRVPVNSLLNNLPTAPIAVISGGEPLMQQDKDGWQPLLAGLHRQGRQVHIETNGTIAPNPVTARWSDMIAVSPKMPSAQTANKINPAAIERFKVLAQRGAAYFKFVAKDNTDLAAIDAFVEQHQLTLPSVWVMPEGATRDTHLASLTQLADPIVERGYNLCTRLHTITWNEERAR